MHIVTAPRNHHDMQPVHLTLLGKAVGPPSPPQLLGVGFLHHHVIQAQVPYPLLLAPLDEQPHQRARGERHHPKPSVECVVAATRQQVRHACLRLAHIQQDQASEVQANQHSQRGTAYFQNTQNLQAQLQLGIQPACATIQPRRHVETIRRVRGLGKLILPVRDVFSVPSTPAYYPTA